MDKRGPFKDRSLQVLKDTGLPIGSIIDVGVLSSTPELLRVFPDRMHLLIEPVVEWNDTIARNYAGVAHEIVNCAASDQDGAVTLEVESVIPGMPISHARMSSDVRRGYESRTVPMATLDRLADERQLKEPFLLKIDVDGAELRVLAGATRMLQRCSVVIVEMGILNFMDRSRPLIEAGFELFDVMGLSYYEDRLRQFDAVFVNTKMLNANGLNMFTKPFDFGKWVNYEP